jgi:hypothetical protein
VSILDRILGRTRPDDDWLVKDAVVNGLAEESAKTLRRVDRLVRLARTDAEIDVRAARVRPR